MKKYCNKIAIGMLEFRKSNNGRLTGAIKFVSLTLDQLENLKSDILNSTIDEFLRSMWNDINNDNGAINSSSKIQTLPIEK